MVGRNQASTSAGAKSIEGFEGILSRRQWLATMMVGMAMTGGAQASSFVTIAPPPANDTPSIIVLGPPDLVVAKPATMASAIGRSAGHDNTAKEDWAVPLAYPLPGSDGAAQPAFVVVSASIIAFDPPAPSVTFEQVAAITPPMKPPIPRAKPHGRQVEPIVIRGGIVGGVSAAPEPVMLPIAKKTANTPTDETRTNAEGKKIVVIKQETTPQKKPGSPAPAETKAIAVPQRQPE